MDITDIRRLFEYDSWANRDVAEAITNSTLPPPNSARLIAHIIGAEAQWLARLKNEPASLPVWPGFTEVNVFAELNLVERRWQEFFEGLDDSALRSPIHQYERRAVHQ